MRDGRRWGQESGCIDGRHTRMSTSDFLFSVFAGGSGSYKEGLQEKEREKFCQRKGLPINNRSEARPRR